MSGLDTILEIPAGLAILLPLMGVVVGMFFLTVAIMLLGRERVPERVKTKVVEETKADMIAIKQPELPISPEVATTDLALAVGTAIVAGVIGSVTGKTKRPAFAKQHHWYYVQKVSGRFATLREALTAAGAVIPNHLDWNRLDPKVRARIRREPFVEGQEEAPEARDNGHERAPELETMRPVATAKATSERTTRLKPPAESVVVVSKRRR